MSKFLTGTLKNLENKINTNERQKKNNKKKKVYRSNMDTKIKKDTEKQRKQLTIKRFQLGFNH